MEQGQDKAGSLGRAHPVLGRRSVRCVPARSMVLARYNRNCTVDHAPARILVQTPVLTAGRVVPAARKDLTSYLKKMVVGAEHAHDATVSSALAMRKDDRVVLFCARYSLKRLCVCVCL